MLVTEWGMPLLFKADFNHFHGTSLECFMATWALRYLTSLTSRFSGCFSATLVILWGWGARTTVSRAGSCPNRISFCFIAPKSCFKTPVDGKTYYLVVLRGRVANGHTKCTVFVGDCRKLCVRAWTPVVIFFVRTATVYCTSLGVQFVFSPNPQVFLGGSFANCFHYWIE